MFVNGTYLASPYEITLTSTELSANGHVIAAVTDLPEAGVPKSLRPRGRGVSRKRQADAFRNRGNRKPHDDSFHELVNALDANEIVVAFENAPLRVISLGSEQHTFCSTLLADELTAGEVAKFSGLSSGPAFAPLWVQFLNQRSETGVPHAELEHRLDAIDAVEASNMASNAAVSRLARFSYPLTIVAMLVGVISLGHMLQWAGRGLAISDESSASPESVSYATTAVWLILGMSVIDLAWTVLAGQAGTMNELNPVAAQFLSSPLQLALFKLAATGIGLFVLYAWRHQRRIQQAAWWMCLVCVLLTFRWVMFDSLTI